MERELVELQASLKSFQSHLNDKETTSYQAWMNTLQTKVEFIARQLDDKHQLEKNYLHLSKDHLKMQQLLDDLQRQLEREQRVSRLLEKTNTELAEALRAMRKQSESDTTMSSIQVISEIPSHMRRASSLEFDAQFRDLYLGTHLQRYDRHTQSDEDFNSSKSIGHLDLIAMLACSASATEASLIEKQDAYDAFVRRM